MGIVKPIELNEPAPVLMSVVKGGTRKQPVKKEVIKIVCITGSVSDLRGLLKKAIKL